MIDVVFVSMHDFDYHLLDFDRWMWRIKADCCVRIISLCGMEKRKLTGECFCWMIWLSSVRSRNSLEWWTYFTIKTRWRYYSGRYFALTFSLLLTMLRRIDRRFNPSKSACIVQFRQTSIFFFNVHVQILFTTLMFNSHVQILFMVFMLTFLSIFYFF